MEELNQWQWLINILLLLWIIRLQWRLDDYRFDYYLIVKKLKRIENGEEDISVERNNESETEEGREEHRS